MLQKDGRLVLKPIASLLDFLQVQILGIVATFPAFESSQFTHMKSRIPLSQSRSLERIAASLLAVCFFMTSISAPLSAQNTQPLSFTQGEIPDLPRSRISQATSATIPLAEIRVPPELGSLEAFHQGSSGRTYIYLKDAHTVPDAQKSLQSLVEYLTTHYGISRVYLEGAEGRLDSLIYQKFPDKKNLHTVFDAYLGRAEISGAATASAFLPHVDFFGMENWKIYQEAHAAFLTASGSQDLWIQKMKPLREILQAEKNRYYSHGALRADRLIQLWAGDPPQMEVFFDALASQEETHELSSWPHLQILVSEWRNKKEILHLDEAVRKQLPSLKAFSEGKSSALWNEKTQQWKTGVLSAGAFLHWMEKEIQSTDPRRAESLHREFQDVLETQKLLSKLRGSEVRAEIELYLKSLEERSFQTSEEKRVAAFSERLRILQRLLEFKLEWKDWLTLKQGTEKKMFKNPPAEPFYGHALEWWSTFQKSFEGQAYLRFYEFASQRTQIFLENISRLEGLDPAEMSLVVAGGFHSEEFLEKLRHRGDSYLEISPSMSAFPEEDQTVGLMRGEVSWKKYLHPKNGAIDLYPAFTQAVTDQLVQSLAGSGMPSGIRPWRDNILRELAKQGRLQEAKSYTQFIDRAISGSSLYPIPERLRVWQKKLDQFLAQAEALHRNGKLDSSHLGKLLSGASTMNSPYSVGPFFRHLALPFELPEAKSTRSKLRSEVRMIEDKRFLQLSSQNPALQRDWKTIDELMAEPLDNRSTILRLIDEHLAEQIYLSDRLRLKLRKAQALHRYWRTKHPAPALRAHYAEEAEKILDSLQQILTDLQKQSNDQDFQDFVAWNQVSVLFDQRQFDKAAEKIQKRFQSTILGPMDPILEKRMLYLLIKLGKAEWVIRLFAKGTDLTRRSVFQFDEVALVRAGLLGRLALAEALLATGHYQEIKQLLGEPLPEAKHLYRIRQDLEHEALEEHLRRTRSSIAFFPQAEEMLKTEKRIRLREMRILLSRALRGLHRPLAAMSLLIEEPQRTLPLENSRLPRWNFYPFLNDQNGAQRIEMAKVLTQAGHPNHAIKYLGHWEGGEGHGTEKEFIPHGARDDEGLKTYLEIAKTFWLLEEYGPAIQAYQKAFQVKGHPFYECKRRSALARSLAISIPEDSTYQDEIMKSFYIKDLRAPWELLGYFHSYGEFQIHPDFIRYEDAWLSACMLLQKTGAYQAAHHLAVRAHSQGNFRFHAQFDRFIMRERSDATSAPSPSTLRSELRSLSMEKEDWRIRLYTAEALEVFFTREWRQLGQVFEKLDLRGASGAGEVKLAAAFETLYHFFEKNGAVTEKFPELSRRLDKDIKAIRAHNRFRSQWGDEEIIERATDFKRLRSKLMPLMEALRRKSVLYDAIAEKGIVSTALRGEMQDLSKKAMALLQSYKSEAERQMNLEEPGASFVSWEKLPEDAVPYQKELRSRRDGKDRRDELERVFHQVMHMYPTLYVLGEKAAFQELQSWIDPKKSNLLDETRIRLGVSPAIAFRGDLMACVLPPQERTRENPWRVMVIAGPKYVGHMAIEGDPKFSKLNIAEGPMNILIKDTEAEYELGIDSELPKLPSLAEATDDNRHGPSVVRGAHLTVLATPGNSTKELVEDAVASLVLAKVSGENLVLSSGANLDTRSMDWAWNAAMNAAIDKKYRWAGKTFGSRLVSKAFWVFFRVWKWLYFNSLFIRKGPVMFKIPPVVGVSKSLGGIAKAELLVDGTSTIAAMLTAMRHPYIREHYFSPRPEDNSLGFRIAFFGAGRVVSQCIEVLSRKNLLETGKEVRRSGNQNENLQQEQIRVIGLRNPQTEILNDDELNLNLLREFQLHVAEGRRDALKGLALQFREKGVEVQEHTGTSLDRGASYEHADLLILGDAPGSFALRDAKKFKGKIVLEGLYNVATPEAVQWMHDENILFLRMSSVNVGSAKAAYHEILNHLFPHYEYGRDYQVLDSIASYVTANLWQQFSKLEQAKGDSRTFAEQIQDANQWFSTEANVMTEALGMEESADSLPGDEEGVRIRLAQVIQQMKPFLNQGLSFPMALALAISGQLLSEDISGVPWQGKNAERIEKEINKKVEQLLEELALDDSLPENRQKRRNAAYTLGKMQIPEDVKSKVTEMLGKVLVRDSYYQAQAEAAKALGRIGYAPENRDKAGEWIQGIAEARGDEPFTAVWWKEVQRVGGYCVLLRVLSDPKGLDPKVQQWVEWALQRYGDKIPWNILIDLAQTELNETQQISAHEEKGAFEKYPQDPSGRNRLMQIPLKAVADAHYRIAVWESMKGRHLSNKTSQAKHRLERTREMTQSNTDVEYHLNLAEIEYTGSQIGGHALPLFIQLNRAESLIRKDRVERAKELLVNLLVPSRLTKLFQQGQMESNAEDLERAISYRVLPQDYYYLMVTAIEKLLILEGFEQEVAKLHANTLGDYLTERESFLRAVSNLSRVKNYGQAIEAMVQEESFGVRAEMAKSLFFYDASLQMDTASLIAPDLVKQRTDIFRRYQSGASYQKKIDKPVGLDFESMILQDFRSKHRKKVIRDNRYLAVDPSFQLLILLASGLYSNQKSLEDGLVQLLLGRMKLKHITIQLPQDTRRIRQIINKINQENLSPQMPHHLIHASEPPSRSELRLLSAILEGDTAVSSKSWKPWIAGYRQSPEKASERLRGALPFYETGKRNPLSGFQGPFETFLEFRAAHPDYDARQSAKLADAFIHFKKTATSPQGQPVENEDYSLVVRYAAHPKMQSTLLQFVQALGALQGRRAKAGGRLGLILNPDEDPSDPVITQLRASGLVEIWQDGREAFSGSLNRFLDHHRNAFFLSDREGDEKLIGRKSQFLLSPFVTPEESLIYLLHELLPKTARLEELNFKTLQALEQRHSDFINLEGGYLILGAALRDWILNARAAEHIASMA